MAGEVYPYFLVNFSTFVKTLPQAILSPRMAVLPAPYRVAPM